MASPKLSTRSKSRTAHAKSRATPRTNATRRTKWSAAVARRSDALDLKVELRKAYGRATH